jgi:hypothetical protein
MSLLRALSLALIWAIFLTSCQANFQSGQSVESENSDAVDAAAEDDFELIEDWLFEKATCAKATNAQVAQIQIGNSKKQDFLDQCGRATGGSPWCQQLIRPNPDSLNIFRCTYGDKLVHQLIHPDENTWKFAYQAVNLVERLESLGVKICIIYNWWRPEPYNKNVGGAAGRHPLGTSVDVRFCSKNDQLKAHKQLCQWRKQGDLRALGYYSSSALHFGVGDVTANTWGKACN